MQSDCKQAIRLPLLITLIYVIMRKRMNQIFNIILYIFFANTFSNCEDIVNVIDVDNVDCIELNEQNSDVMIVPIKCAFPMDEIYRSIGYDDYTFLMGMSWKTIYCVQKDTVISVLEASGRGHGEYTHINDFAYSEEEHILYVQADGKLLKYSVPSMSFISSIDFEITSKGMIVLNSNEILMNCSYLESENNVYRGICVVSSLTGKVIHKCFDFEYINSQSFMARDLTMTDNGLIFPLNDLLNKKIICYDVANNNYKELFSYTFNSRWKTPKRLVKLAKKDPLLYSQEDYKQLLHCNGGHYPFTVNTALAFWCFPREKEDIRSVVSIVKNDEIIRRSFKISGTDMDPSPYHIYNRYCVDIITPLDMEITNEGELTSFGTKLYKATSSQPYGNPVLLYFTVDKGL